MKTPERRQWCRLGVFIVNFEHISHLFIVFLLLTLNKYILIVFFMIADFEQNKASVAKGYIANLL